MKGAVRLRLLILTPGGDSASSSSSSSSSSPVVSERIVLDRINRIFRMNRITSQGLRELFGEKDRIRDQL
jgi:hypothetical protein